MKCFWRRIIAFTLTMCITLSILPPVVLATEGSQIPNQTPAGNDQMVYDFGLGVNNETFGDAATPYAGKNLSDTKKAENVAAKEAIDERYTAGTLNWKFHSAGNTAVGTATGWNFDFGSGVNYKLTLRTTGYLPDAYFAATIRSPGDGDYKLTLEYFTHRTGASKGSVYILPGDTQDIAATLTTATAVGSFSCESNNSNGTTMPVETITFDDAVPMKADAEYLLVFTADEVSSIKNDRATLYIGNVKLTEQVAGTPDESTPDESTPDESTPDESTPDESTPDESIPEETLPALQVDELVYDFDLRAQAYTYTSGGNTTPTTLAGVNLAGTGNKNIAGKAFVSDLYSDGTIHWNYHSVTDDVVSKGFGFGADGTEYSLVLTGKDAEGNHLSGVYFATTIHSPGTGDYKMTVDYYTHSTGAAQGSVYILPVDTTNIAAAIASGTAAGTIRYESTADGRQSVTFDNAVSMESGEEYLLVFTNDVKNTAGNRASLYLNSVKLVKTGSDADVPPVQADQLVYDFDLQDYDFTYISGDSPVTGPIAGVNLAQSSNKYNAARTQLGELYRNQTIHWNYHSVSDSAATKTFSLAAESESYRLNLMGRDADGNHLSGVYFAATIRSPGTGDYKLTLTSYTHNTGAGKGSVYILPVGTTDIVAAIAAGTAVGSFSCESAESFFDMQRTTFASSVSMEAGKEYLLVFTNDVKNAAGTRATLYLDSVTLTKAGLAAPEDIKPGEAPLPDTSADPLPPVQRDQIVYEFGLPDMGLTYGDNVTFENRNLATSSAGRTGVKGLYDNGTVHWKYLSKSDSAAKAYFTIGRTTNFYNLTMYAKTASGEVVGQYYYATTIRSPGTGDYKLTVDYYVGPYGAKQGSIYILPNNTRNIAAAIASGNAAGVIKFDNGNTKEEAGRVTFEAAVPMELGKEYIMVFACDEPGRTDAIMYIDRVMLTKSGIATPADIVPQLAPDLERVEIQSQRDKVVYDFDLGHNSNLTHMGSSFATKNLLNAAVKSTVNTFYNYGITDWKYHSATTGANAYAMFGGVGAEREHKWPGVCMYSRDPETNAILSDYYIAMTIRSPGTGDYKLTLDYGVHMNGAKQGSVYIFPADTTDIAAAIAANKAIGTTNYDNGATATSYAAEPGRSTFGNAVSMEAGKEYLLVFTADLMGRAHAALYVDSVTLTKVGVTTPADIIPKRVPERDPIPAGSTVYDLDLADPVRGIYRTGYVQKVMDELHSRYASGTSNWDWLDHKILKEEDTVFKSTGLMVYAAEMEWIAIKIKSPGKGLHTVGMNYAISRNGGTGAIYILPADTEDIGGALDIDNRVGIVSFTDMNGETTVVDAGQTYAGTWEFGEDDEYIMVIEAYKDTIFEINRCYMMISEVFMTPGDVMKQTEDVKVISPVTIDPGPVKILESCYYGMTTKVNGCNYLYMPTEGKKMLVFDLDNDRLVDQIDTPHSRCYGIDIDSDGNIWTVGQGKQVHRYNVHTGVGETVIKVDQINPEAANAFYMKYVDGYMYFGLMPVGTVVKYEIATGKFQEFGPFHEDTNYLNAIEYKDGFLYVGIGGDYNQDGQFMNRVIKLDAETGEQVDYADVNDLVGDKEHKIFAGIGFAGDLLLLGANSAYNTLLALDPETMDVVDVGVKSNIYWEITEELDGKVYFYLSGMGLHSMDVETHEVKVVPGLDDAPRNLRCGDHSIVEVDDPLYPGPSIVTYNGVGEPLLYNLETGRIKNYFEAIESDDFGLGVALRGMTPGLPGSNEIYTGAFNTPECAIYNTETGEISKFEAVSAQTDAMVWYNGKLYTGNYNIGAITQINLEDPKRNQILLSMKDEYNQVRIHTMAAGDDKIFAGTIPFTGDYGGALAWIDLKNMERHVEVDVVLDQSVHDIVYHDGLIYGVTTIDGGSTTKLREDLCAKLFIYDVENKVKLGEYDLRDYIGGFEKNIQFINTIEADPNIDENGRLWGVVSETLFSFTYDRDTGKLSVKEELSFNKDYYPSGNSRSFCRPMYFDGNGNMYVAFFGTGGMRRVNLENTADNERIMPLTPNHYALGEDGNIYFTSSSDLCMYPLNVTDEDWAVADKVDQMILAIGNEITLKSEETIVAARAAYESLDIRYKALIQKLTVLEEAEVELLELQINELPETVTLEHQELIQGLVAKYKAMTKRQQLYVKNYDSLKAADTALNVLLDKQAAAKVQELINTIPDLGVLTLDHMERIDEINAAYHALYSYQKQYVDTTLLDEALARMAELRAEQIEHLKELIASIGEVTLEDEHVIVEADGIFNWLTLEERQQVDGATLSSARIQLTKLQKEAAGQVDALIGKIGNVGIFSGSAITKARKGYDALTEGSKAYVSLIDTLLAAEKAFKPIAITLWCIGGVVVAGGAATVVVLKKKRKAVPAKQEEIAE